MVTAEQLLDIIGTYLEQSVARPTVTLDQAIRAVRDLEAELARLKKDAELGAMVRRLPFDESLTSGSRDGSYWIVEDSICGHAHGPAPEDALRSFYARGRNENHRCCDE